MDILKIQYTHALSLSCFYPHAHIFVGICGPVVLFPKYSVNENSAIFFL